MDFSGLKKELDSGNQRNFYVFVGEEKAVMERYLKRLGIEKVVRSVYAAIPLLTGGSLFTKTVKLAIEDQDSLEEIDYKHFKKLCSRHTVVLICDKVDNRKKFFKEAKEDLVEFNSFTSEQLAYHVRSQLLCEVTDELAVMIARQCRNEVLRIDNECHKLKMLDRPITVELINQVISPTAEDRIFEVVDGLLSNDMKRTLDILADLKELGEPPIKVLAILYGRFEQVLVIQWNQETGDYQMPTVSKYTAWQSKMTRPLINKKPTEYFIEGMAKIYATEEQVKNSANNDWNLLHALIFELGAN